MILSIDGFNLTQLSYNEQTIDGISKGMTSRRESQVKLRVQKICDDGDRKADIVVTTKMLSHPYPHWFNENVL